MVLNPLRMLRRHERLKREALDEAQVLRRRHGDGAIAAARAKLARPDLTSWYRLVLERAIQVLQKELV
jgi:hypothetical protein